MRAYFDADVLIWHLRGDAKAQRFFTKLSEKKEYDFWTGAMQRSEIVCFMRPEEEKKTYLFLAQFKTAPIDQECIDLAGALFRKWNPSHGLDVNDAILAAQAIQTGGKIYCFNKKHYPMPEVIVEKPF